MQVIADHMDCLTPDEKGKTPEMITLVVEARRWHLLLTRLGGRFFLKCIYRYHDYYQDGLVGLLGKKSRAIANGWVLVH